MREIGKVHANIVTFGVVMDAYARASEWQEALGLLKDMINEGIKPSQVIYGSALTACRNAGQWEAAQALLNEMMSQGGHAAPNRRCYNIVMDACGRAGTHSYHYYGTPS